MENKDFEEYTFLDKSGNEIPKSTHAIISKMKEITHIEERRYAGEMDTRSMASKAGEAALDKIGFDKEELGGIIIAHNFGDVHAGENQGLFVPNMAAKVKHDLKIKNSKCFAYDVIYGCPGWLLAMDQAHQYIKNGVVSSVLVIGVDSLSGVVDPNDIDSLLFGDAAGAVLLAGVMEQERRGILGYESHSDCGEEIEYLTMSKPIVGDEDKRFIRMNGRSVFKYAVSHVPEVINECLSSCRIPFKKVSKFFFHQANGKMLETIGQKLAESNEVKELNGKVPTNLQKTGNTSVATIPTLLDEVLDGLQPTHSLKEDDIVVLASVGAGMHANCLVYQF